MFGLAHQCGVPNTGLPSRPTGALPCRYSFIAFRLLVALLDGRDLLLCAKHLFSAARTVVAGGCSHPGGWQVRRATA
jgi:hypothetical protein